MKNIIAVFLLFSPLMAFTQPDSISAHYKIYSTSKQKLININDIVSDMRNADVLFFGEVHDDAVAHHLEFTLLKRLNDKYPQQTALSMEMFETDCQTVLDEYLSGLIREKNFVTDSRAWPNYKDYRPIIEFARMHSLPVVAANAPSRYANMATRLGLISLQQLSPAAKIWLPPLPIDTLAGAYYQKFIQIMGGHGTTGAQFYQAQNLWDATMAWSIAKFWLNRPRYKVLQINGGFHSEEKLGAAIQIKKYAPKIRLLNIAAYNEENYAVPDWNKLNKMADYIILTNPKAN